MHIDNAVRSAVGTREIAFGADGPPLCQYKLEIVDIHEAVGHTIRTGDVGGTGRVESMERVRRA